MSDHPIITAADRQASNDADRRNGHDLAARAEAALAAVDALEIPDETAWDSLAAAARLCQEARQQYSGSPAVLAWYVQARGRIAGQAGALFGPEGRRRFALNETVIGRG